MFFIHMLKFCQKMTEFSEDMESSDEEFDELADFASTIMENFSEDAKMAETYSNSSDSSSSSNEESDDSIENVDEEGNTELFIVDRKPMTQSNKNLLPVGDADLENNDSRHARSSSSKTKSKKRKKKERNSKSKQKDVDDHNEFHLASEIGAGMELPGIYINVKPWQNPLKKMDDFTQLQKNRQQKDLKVMEKTVLTPDFERKETVPKYHEAVRKMKRDRKKQRAATKGSKWFDLPATDLSEDKQKSFEILQMRKALDPKRFYKSNDLTDFPKYSQFGTIVEDTTEFYSARIPKKQRKQTLVDELLADAEFRTYNKRKFEEIQSSKRRGTGSYEGSKRMINKKKGPMHNQANKRQKKFFINSKALSKGWRPKK